MAYRKMMNYPPAMNLLAILMTSLQEEMLEKFAEEIKVRIEAEKKENITIIGPAQATVSKIQDYYRKVIYIKHENYDILTKVKDGVEFYVKKESRYPECFIQFDFNPVFTY